MSVQSGADETGIVWYEPWIGPAYSSHGLSGIRVLLLGESHYLSPGDEKYDQTDLTTGIIEGVREGTRQLRFYTTVARLIESVATDASDGEHSIWDRVAFANLIPGRVADRAGVRPSSEKWGHGLQNLPRLLDATTPHAVLVLGIQMWRWIEQWLPADWERWREGGQAIGASGRWSAGQALVMARTRHPSRGFSVDKHRPLVAELLRRGRMIAAG